MDALRIMSSNIWWCDTNHPTWENMGASCVPSVRAQGLARMYKETMPDLIGLQECSGRMSHQLMAYLIEQDLPYALLWGRDTPIVYRKDKFELVDSEVLLYPEEIPGFEGSFNNLKTKSYCIALLRLKENGRLLLLATTHLWYKSGNPKSPSYQPHSEEARHWQLSQLLDRMDALQKLHQCPAVVLGDFNTYPNSAAVKEAISRGFVHGHDAATDYADETCGMHFCCAEGFHTTLREGGFETSIDHILLRGETITVSRFERSCPDYFFPISDHSPVWVDMTF